MLIPLITAGSLETSQNPLSAPAKEQSVFGTGLLTLRSGARKTSRSGNHVRNSELAADCDVGTLPETKIRSLIRKTAQATDRWHADQII